MVEAGWVGRCPNPRDKRRRLRGSSFGFSPGHGEGGWVEMAKATRNTTMAAAITRPLAPLRS